MQFMPSLRHKALNQEKVLTIANTIITITNINIIIVTIIIEPAPSTKHKADVKKSEGLEKREQRSGKPAHSTSLSMQ